MSEETVQKKEPKVPGPRRFYAFQYKVNELIDLGIHNNIKEADAAHQCLANHQWPLAETEVNRWIKLVREHPEPTAHFALDYDIGTLVYLGDYESHEAAVAARAVYDPEEKKHEVLLTDKLREWKTTTSEGPKMKLIPD